MASVLSVPDGWLETKPSLFVYLGHVGMSSELAFQFHRFEVNPMVRSEVMPVLLRSGQSVSRERAVDRTNGLSIDSAPLPSVDGLGSSLSVLYRLWYRAECRWIGHDWTKTCTGWRHGVTDWLQGCGAEYVLTDPGVIRDWFWGAKHG
ncbi:hypothetical protein F2Q68_00040033 [Brassica cretica]|uniref:Uncharacterized protein n=1 Tax=Brassica cretica TaxID=69181 RepID=A0A8S9MLP2_BRACR|nr:hypothetical protein F2Q68_00040033 [Brassica cretica]